MTLQAISTHVGIAVSDQLCERLQSMGMTLLKVSARGSVHVVTKPTWFEQKLISSPVFEQAVARQWKTLATSSGQAVELFEGVSLVPLVSRRRRRLAVTPSGQPLAAVLLLGPAVLESEQLHQVCAHHQLDREATCGRIDRSRLLGPNEAARLVSALTWMHQDSTEIERRCYELQHMGQELADSYEELSLLYKLSTNMTVNQPPASFLTDACQELQQVLGLRWMALQLADDDPRLQDLAGQLFIAGPMQGSAALKRAGKALLKRFGPADEPTIIDDTMTLGMSDLPALATSLLVVPLHLQGKPLAILFGGDKADHNQISSVDSKLCDSLGNSLTIFLDNMMLYEDMHEMFLGTLHALTSAIDAKDSYTHGHSERVALVSRMLAEAAGLDDRTVQRVYVSGLVHDVGKIGVPESVLCKPGRLNKEEFELIKRHPQIGARILEDIRQMHDLIPGVLCHHERWDGRGYPHGMRGEEIPLFGRLIGLADAFDAMSSNRTYRRALASQQVLDEIRACGGEQFDPRLVEVFVNLDFSPFIELIQKHQSERAKRSA